jgi:hypothetical protein
MDWKKIFEKYQLDYSPLEKFSPKEGVSFLDDEEFSVTEEWLKNYNLNFHILPVFTNHESDMVGVFTSGVLKGKVTCINHDDICFAPRFRNLESFITQVNTNEDVFDWQDFTDNFFDYPNKQAIPTTDKETDKTILAECWKLIAQQNPAVNNYQNYNYQLLAETIVNITPYSEIENIISFLDTDDASVRQRAACVFGVVYQYLPTKEKVREIVKNYGKSYLNRFYSGQLFKKEKN